MQNRGPLVFLMARHGVQWAVASQMTIACDRGPHTSCPSLVCIFMWGFGCIFWGLYSWALRLRAALSLLHGCCARPRGLQSPPAADSALLGKVRQRCGGVLQPWAYVVRNAVFAWYTPCR